MARRPGGRGVPGRVSRPRQRRRAGASSPLSRAERTAGIPALLDAAVARLDDASIRRDCATRYLRADPGLTFVAAGRGRRHPMRRRRPKRRRSAGGDQTLEQTVGLGAPTMHAAISTHPEAGVGDRGRRRDTTRQYPGVTFRRVTQQHGAGRRARSCRVIVQRRHRRGFPRPRWRRGAGAWQECSGRARRSASRRVCRGSCRPICQRTRRGAATGRLKHQFDAAAGVAQAGDARDAEEFVVAPIERPCAGAHWIDRWGDVAGHAPRC